jgi:MFS family permease
MNAMNDLAAGMGIRLGLKENLNQFILLVLVNAFVGGMVGLERTILPQIAEAEFHIAAKTAILSFIVVFGIAKACTNYFTGFLSIRLGRKSILVAGWIFAVPVPFILMGAGSWSWIIAANLLLGISQGLTWSTTVIMKIDLVGDRNRGLAMGLNECAGYVALAAVAFFTGLIAGEYGLRPYPFYIGIALVFLGLVISIVFVRDTQDHVTIDATLSSIPRLKSLFWETSVRDRNLGTVTQAGLINNMNDGMVWGLLPLLLHNRGFPIAKIAVVTAVYPAVWGIGQIVTGRMSDFFCKKRMLAWGMLIQGVALFMQIFASTFLHFVVLSALLGWGTAMVYPTFLATIAENVHPYDRAQSLGVFRFWRDLGYAVGAVLTGVLADALGITASVFVIAVLTLLSWIVIEVRMRCNVNRMKPGKWRFQKFATYYGANKKDHSFS